MSILSMTGFASIDANNASEQDALGSISIVIKSVNHRYLELNIKLPSALSSYENEYRQLLQESILRGKVDVWIKLNLVDNNQSEVNEEKVKNILDSFNKINQLTNLKQEISLMRLMNMEGVLISKEQDNSKVHEHLKGLIKNAITQLVETKAREGAKLLGFLNERLHLIEKELYTIKQSIPLCLKLQKEKLESKLTDLVAGFDKDRIEQEMVLLVQKSDIAEEIDRFGAHLVEVKRVLNAGGSVGRRLDFLMQELNREVNTMGSKMLHTTISHACVELKVLLEQMREQIQNIE